jgi:hypothetical protein
MTGSDLFMSFFFILQVRGYLMISRGPSYDLAPPPSPLHFSRQEVVSLSQSSCVSPIELTDGKGGEGVGGTKSYDGLKAWFFGNNSILSDSGRCLYLILLYHDLLYSLKFNLHKICKKTQFKVSISVYAHVL